MGPKKKLTNGCSTLQLAVSDVLLSNRMNIYYGALDEEAFPSTNMLRSERPVNFDHPVEIPIPSEMPVIGAK